MMLCSPVVADDYGAALFASINEDDAIALKDFKLLATAGDGMSQYRLGVMYISGNGVLQDHVMAHMWFNLANTNGIQSGGGFRDSVAAEMTLENISKAQDMARKCLDSNYKECGY